MSFARCSLPSAVLVCAILVVPATTAVAQTGTLDQSQTASATYVYLVSGSLWPQVAQIATAGRYGILGQVWVYVDNLYASGPIGVSLQTVIGGAPSGVEIGRGEIPVDRLPAAGNPEWVMVMIDGGFGLAMAPGTRYAIVLSSPPTGAVRWYASTDVYSGGYAAINPGSGWSSTPNADAMFQTYVIPDTLDQRQMDAYRMLSLDSRFGTPEQGAQTFTAGLTGVIDRVGLHMQRAFEFSGDVQLSIQTTDNGQPSGVEVGHGVIPSGAIPNLSQVPDWVEARITPSGYLYRGHQYALVVGGCCGQFWWDYANAPSAYPGGAMLYNGGNGWTVGLPIYQGPDYGDAAFQTFVVPQFPSLEGGSPDSTKTPCSSGICPAVSGNVTPADSTARVTSNVQFKEQPDGTIHAVLTFNDSRTGDFVLQGCTTDSTACRLTVTRFACTDQHSIDVAGSYTPKGETAHDYELTLSGVNKGIGTFTLSVDGYKYTLSRQGIVNVTCPPVGGK